MTRLLPWCSCMLSARACLRAARRPRRDVAGRDRQREREVRDLVRARREGRLQQGVALLHSFWFPEAIKAFEAILAARPELRDGALGHRAEQLGQPVRRHQAGAHRSS